MALQFHWGGQVSADIQAQNQMLFDAMTPEQQQQVLEAQAERNAVDAAQYAADAKYGAKMVIGFGLIVGLVGVLGQVGLFFVIGAVLVGYGLIKLRSAILTNA